MHVCQLVFLWKNNNSSLDFLNVSLEFLSISFHVATLLYVMRGTCLASVQRTFVSAGSVFSSS